MGTEEYLESLYEKVGADQENKEDFHVQLSKLSISIQSFSIKEPYN